MVSTALIMNAWLTLLTNWSYNYDVTINIANPKLKDINYTCKFRQRDGIEKILHTIQKIHHFKIEIDKENNVITLK